MTAGAGSGARPAALREAVGLSQRALARRAGTTPATLRRWERGAGAPRPVTVGKVAAVLGVPAEELGEGGGGAAASLPGDLPPGLCAALARRGVALGSAGYDAPTLAAAAEAFGWRCAVEERAPSERGRYRYQALVFGPGTPGHPARHTGRARGETEAEALAKALLRLLERAG